MSALVACPHCGRQIDTRGNGARHMSRCPLDPALRDAIKAALTGADGYSVSHNRYMAAAQRGDLPSRTALVQALGSWAAALAHYGVPMSPRSAAGAQKLAATRSGRRRNDAAVDERVGAEVDAAMEEAQREIEYARYLTERGLAVCGEPRRLASGGTAWMLR